MKKLLLTWVLCIAAVLLCVVALAKAAEVTLEWDPPTEGVVTGYKIYQGTASGKYEKNVDVGLQRTITMRDLLPGTTYFWAATAYNETEESGFSNEVSKTIPAEVAMPTPVVSASSNGVETAFSIATGSAVPTRYLIRIAEAPADPNNKETSVLYTGTSSPIIIKDLAQGKTYNYYGRYNIGDAVSAKSAQGTITIPTVVILKPPMTLIIKAEE